MESLTLIYGQFIVHLPRVNSVKYLDTKATDSSGEDDSDDDDTNGALEVSIFKRIRSV
jgi:hypothetical protein